MTSKLPTIVASYFFQLFLGSRSPMGPLAILAGHTAHLHSFETFVRLNSLELHLLFIAQWSESSHLYDRLQSSNKEFLLLVCVGEFASVITKIRQDPKIWITIHIGVHKVWTKNTGLHFRGNCLVLRLLDKTLDDFPGKKIGKIEGFLFSSNFPRFGTGWGDFWNLWPAP